jgi:cyclic beta-1,2-glucan synthetase
VVLVENLRRLAERLALTQATKELANRVCDKGQPLDACALDALLARLRLRGADMALRLRDPKACVDPQVRQWLQPAVPDAATTQAQHSAEQAAANLSVINAVTSLRAITHADWPDIVSRASALMRLMLTALRFAAEHTTTRDQTLHGIERLARRCGSK